MKKKKKTWTNYTKSESRLQFGWKQSSGIPEAADWIAGFLEAAFVCAVYVWVILVCVDVLRWKCNVLCGSPILLQSDLQCVLSVWDFHDLATIFRPSKKRTIDFFPGL